MTTLTWIAYDTFDNYHINSADGHDGVAHYIVNGYTRNFDRLAQLGSRLKYTSLHVSSPDDPLV